MRHADPYLLDTNVVSEMMRVDSNPTVLSFVDRASRSGVHISVITEWEILNGLGMMAHGRRRWELQHRFETFVDTVFGGKALPVDRQVAKHCAQIMEIRRRAGRSLDAHLPDALIAATALANGMTLATRDAHDFAGAGLDLVDPWAHTPQG